MTTADPSTSPPESLRPLTKLEQSLGCRQPPEQPTEPQILAWLIRHDLDWGRKGTVMPHYTPAHWWECDLAHFSQAGYLTEYEIKVSLQDFRKDRKKTRERARVVKNRQKFDPSWEPTYKHASVEKGRGPKRFWFCAPAGIIPLEELPEWAGLMEFYWRPRTRWAAGGREELPGEWDLTRRILKHAPTVKGARKYGQEVIDHCRGVAYYRLLEYLVKGN